jgi:hypothetical protein
MMNLTEYRKHFASEIRWVGDKKLDLFNKSDSKHQKAFIHLEQYERDLHIVCRRLDLLLNKYPNQKDISHKERDAAERLCFDVRFKRKDEVSEALKNVRT